ncbi:MAG: S41 family peptidase [Anaerolineales bacterium]
MKNKTVNIIIAVLISSILAIGIFSAGLVLGTILSQAGTTLLTNTNSPIVSWFAEPTAIPSTPLEDDDVLFKPFWQVWSLVHEEYVDQPLDDKALMRGAINGALEAIGDPQTSYMDPDEYIQANIPLIGSYEGIGAWVDTDGEYLTIISPMPGSPAERAGMKPGDEVVAIDGEDMTGVDGNIVIRKVMGPAGSTVLLTVRRADVPDLLEFEVVREQIEVSSVESEMLEDGIGYVQILSFSGETISELRSALRELLEEEPSGMILDLRGNGGGFLDSAIDVSSEFIAEGLILTEKFGDGVEETYDSSGKGLATDLPLVVLINAGSASASEIVAGAIQDSERGVLVGETSFGKGSVQFWLELDDDEGALRVTVARWYTPEGRIIDQEGLLPDFEVILTEEDFEAETDPQLDKAIEVLLEMIAENMASSK